MSVYMYMFSMKSAGGLDVKKAMGVDQIKHEGSRFRGSREKVVINWGCGSHLPEEVMKCHVINSAESVFNAIDKRTFLRLCAYREVRTVPFTTEMITARDWLRQGHTVYARTRLEGRQGQGIVICKTENQLVPARLYSKYIEALREYRVHVVDGEVIVVHRKVRDAETPRNETTDYIRNTENGWLFKRVTQYPEDICTQGINAIRAAGLDFGVVDILWASSTPDRCQLQRGAGEAYVLEANTAPGIDTMEYTCSAYAEALHKLAKKKLDSN